jgi:hypothetical protein
VTLRPTVDDTNYFAMALQVAMHFWQASAHFLQQGMSPHFKHSAAQFSHAFAHSPHIAPDSGASYSINATHARHVSKHVRQCFSQLGQSQLTRHSRHARRHSLHALTQLSLSTGSSVTSAEDAGHAHADASKIDAQRTAKIGFMKGRLLGLRKLGYENKNRTEVVAVVCHSYQAVSARNDTNKCVKRTVWVMLTIGPRWPSRCRY